MEQNQKFGKKLYELIDVLYLEVETAELLRIAGNDKEDVLRNSQGIPILPGTSIAGAVQDYLKERKEHHYHTFWGNEKFDNKVYFFDSSLIAEYSNTGKSLEKRTRHKHNAIFGGAEDEKLFPENYLKRGSRFGIVAKTFTFQKEQKMVTDFFEDMINGLENGEILLGSNKNNGCGQIHVKTAKRAQFDFTNPNNYVRYYEFVPENANDPSYQEFTYQKQTINSNRITLILRAFIRDALLIRAEQIGKQDAEYQVMEPMQSNGEFIIPGSTIKGILRGYCAKICKTVGINDKKKELWIELLFGAESMDTKNADSSDHEQQEKYNPKKGCIRIKDIKIEDTAQLEYTRIKIDRFTGGTITGAKMTSNPVTRGNLSIHLEMKPDIPDGEQGMQTFRIAFLLLFLSLRDLGQGKIPIGSFSSVGFGRLKDAELEMRIPNIYTRDVWDEKIMETDDFGIEGSVTMGSSVEFNGNIKGLLEKCMDDWKEQVYGGQKNGD